MSTISSFRHTLPLLMILALPVVGCSDDAASNNDSEQDTGNIDFPDLSDDGDDVDQPEDMPELLTCIDEDDLSPNHSIDTASAAPLTGFERENLHICPGFDDFFAIEMQAGDTLVAEIEFAHRLGDLDFFLLPEGVTLPDPDAAVATSATDQDVESLRFDAESSGVYVLWVNGFENGSGFYDLAVHQGCRVDDDCPESQACELRSRACHREFDPVCGADSFEPNNTQGSATTIELSTSAESLLTAAVCADDVDYFRVVLSTFGDLRITLEFGREFDLDLAVLDDTGDVIGASVSTNPFESLDLRRLAPGTYLVYVDTTAGGAAENEYELRMALSDTTACVTDADCGGVESRELCGDSGGCVAFQPDEPSPAGGACDSEDDCAEGFCYVDEAGFGDNLCTGQCANDADCDYLDDGQCVALNFRTAICLPQCAADFDCPAGYLCDGGTCDFVVCGVDSDCEDGRACVRDENGTAFCRDFEDLGCDGVTDGNSTTATAQAVALDAFPLTDLTICDNDVDWYQVVLPESPTTMTVELETNGGADLDLFVYDESGESVGSSAEEGGDESTTMTHLAAGTYLIYVNQFPNGSNGITTYDLDVQVTISDDPCEVDGDENVCLGLEPLRILCLESGACGFLVGDGDLEGGELCDSSDDCSGENAFCYTFEGAANGLNICTHQCGQNLGCDDVPGSTCVPLGGRFAACLPE